MTKLHIVSGRHLRMSRLRHRFLFKYAVDTVYTFIDVARIASQECQFINGGSHTRSHDNEEQPYYRQ